MAGVFSRFSVANENTIQELKNSSKNENTQKSTSFWFSVWQKWCSEKGINDKIQEYEPANLNNLLEIFYAEVKNKNGEDYEPESLKVMMTSLDRYLKDKGYDASIIRDRVFHSSKQVLEGKAKQLRQSGRGKRPNKARQVSQEEEEILWMNESLGSKTPESLIQTMWWLLTQHFGMRGRQEHHSMRMEDFRITKGDDGIEYVEFEEGPTKTRQSGLSSKPRQFIPRMFQTGGERCPVQLFREYIKRRPQHLKHSGPFYLSIKNNRRANDDIWYKVLPMGVNKINSMMKEIISGTSLESSDKKFSNHSARKTVVSKMKKANLERAAIAKVTGHRNIQSLDDYDEGDEEEQRKLSWAISQRNSATKHLMPSTSAIPPANHPQLMTSSQAQNLMNSFVNCTVTFNVNNKAVSPILPSEPSNARKRRYQFIESDSDTD